MIWCILIPLLVGLLCAYLGYLLGRLCGKKEVKKCKETITKLEADLASCNKNNSKLKSLETDLGTWKTKASKLEGDLNASNKTNLSLKADSDNLAIWKGKASKFETDLNASNQANLSLKAQGDELAIWKSKVAKLEADLNASNKTNLSLKSSSDDLALWKSKVAKLESDLANANKTNLSLKSQGEDLTIWKNKAEKLEADLADSHKNKMSLTADLSACKQSRTLLETNLNNANNSLAASLAAASLLPFNGDAAKAVFGKKIKQDDLKIVEGIGPKIEGLFHDFEIKTWKALSETSIEKCQEVLNSGGDRYKIHNPGTWPKQAEFAYKGEWADLLKWQDELDGGK